MTLGWVVLALAYLGLLFWLGRWGEKDSPLARKLTSHPATYALAMGIYCTAWTFFGAVGEASRDTWQYFPILLGPALVYLFGYRMVYKMVLVGKKQNSTTIADFVSSRYGKRQTVALLVTLIALLATIPYIALQLKAIGAAFQMLSARQESGWLVLVASVFIAVFAMYFGTRQTDITEHRRGLTLAIAFESTVKLLALILIALTAYAMWRNQHQGPLMAAFFTQQSLSGLFSAPFLIQTLIAGAAVLCLPRQFHVAVVDNLSPDHVKTARWLFPLYLLITALVIPVIAASGNSLLGGNSTEPDTYVLGLAILSNSYLLQGIVLVGGLSAATAMIIIATLTLSTMVTNDVILPRILSQHTSTATNQNITRRILTVRRIVIGGLLGFAYLYQQQMANSSSLASIGLVAFSLVVQLLPAIVGGLYWKTGHAHGVYAGLLAGLLSWFLWLMLPLFGTGNLNLQSDTISTGALLSLVINALFYVFFSRTAPLRLMDRIQAQAFVAPREQFIRPDKSTAAAATNEDLLTLLATFVGESRANVLKQEYEYQFEDRIEQTVKPSQAFIHYCERALSGVLGASSARALIDSALSGKKMDFEEVVNFFDDTTQAIKFNSSALFTAIESLEQGISVIDKDLNLVAWNKRYLELFEYPEGLISVGTPVEQMVRYNAEKGECGIGEVEQLVQKRLAHLKAGHPHRFVRQRGDGKMIEMVGNPLPGGGFITSFHDITRHIEIQQALQEANIDLEKRVQKRAEEVQAINAELRSEITRRAALEDALVAARSAAEQANDSKTRFLALASHDVLQPLNAAKLYLSALDQEVLPPAAADIVDKLSSSVSSSEELIATLLDIARLDQNELQPNIQSYNVRALLRPILASAKVAAEQKGLTLRERIADIWVATDKTYLQRILQNLLNNAVKYTQSGGVLISVRKRADNALIQVWDTGIGIADSEQRKIFTDFYRVDGSQQHGVGLGLGVVTRLAEQLGLPVTLRSRPGRGSCFALQITTAQPITKPDSSAHSASGSLSRLRALCVDDRDENLDALNTLLERWGITAYLANAPEQAEKMAAENAPNLLLVDYQLGHKVDGIALIERLRNTLGEDLPAILITANQEPTVITECQEKGIGYLAKPIKPAKLRLILKGLKPRTTSSALIE